MRNYFLVAQILSLEGRDNFKFWVCQFLVFRNKCAKFYLILSRCLQTLPNNGCAQMDLPHPSMTTYLRHLYNTCMAQAIAETRLKPKLSTRYPEPALKKKTEQVRYEHRTDIIKRLVGFNTVCPILPKTRIRVLY